MNPILTSSHATPSEPPAADHAAFVRILAHDMRNLMNDIALTAALLKATAGDSAEGRRTLGCADRIQQQLARMNRLAGHAVDIASLDAGNHEVYLAPGDVGELLHDAMAPFVSLAAQKGISLSVAPMVQLTAELDRDCTDRVLAHLLSNAVGLTGSGGRVELHAELVGDVIRIGVSNTGRSIPQDQLDSMFAPRWRTWERELPGRGLGLVACKGLIEAQGGRIWAESDPHAGSSVYFTLVRAMDTTH